jgi:hypothetical protein
MCFWKIWCLTWSLHELHRWPVRGFQRESHMQGMRSRTVARARRKDCVQSMRRGNICQRHAARAVLRLSKRLLRRISWECQLLLLFSWEVCSCGKKFEMRRLPKWSTSTFRRAVFVLQRGSWSSRRRRRQRIYSSSFGV